MTSLVWRRHEPAVDPAAVPEPDAPVWPVLAALEITTPDRRIRGWIAPEGERTSDWLNRGLEVELIGPVVEEASDPAGGLPEPDRASRRVRYPVDDILFAVPPALPAGRHLRLHRRIHGIHFEIGPYEMYGRIHVRPGAQPDDFLLRSPRLFVPITDVDLVHHVTPEVRRRLPVLIVNARHVTRLYGTGAGSASHAVRMDASSALAASPPPMGPARDEPVTPLPLEADPAPIRGDIHRSLAELVALREDGFVTEREYREKRREILARL